MVASKLFSETSTVVLDLPGISANAGENGPRPVRRPTNPGMLAPKNGRAVVFADGVAAASGGCCGPGSSEAHGCDVQVSPGKTRSGRAAFLQDRHSIARRKSLPPEDAPGPDRLDDDDPAWRLLLSLFRNVTGLIGRSRVIDELLPIVGIDLG